MTQKNDPILEEEINSIKVLYEQEKKKKDYDKSLVKLYLEQAGLELNKREIIKKLKGGEK